MILMIMMIMMTTTTTMIIIIIIIITIIMTVRPSKIRVIINKANVFSTRYQCKAYCALKKNSISLCVNYTKFQVFRQGFDEA